MSLSNTSENSLALLLFNNTAWTGIGDAGGLLPSAAAGVFWIRLHTADPGEAGTQSTSEAAYTGYAAVSVPRTSAGFTVAANIVSNTAQIAFAECTAGTATITHFTVGTASTGTGLVLYRGALSASRSISAGITPIFNAGTLTGTFD
jgi:hypothetical protein